MFAFFWRKKGPEIPTQQLNVRDDNQFAKPFASMNPLHCVLFLELDNGLVITGSMSICRYPEELRPEPPLYGRTAEERAVIDMWLRRFELDAFMPMLHAMRNHVPMFAGRVVPGARTALPQPPEMVTRGKEMREIFLGCVELHMAKNAFVAGPHFTVADITGYFAVRPTKPLEMDVASSYPAIAAWFAKVSARPAFRI